MKKVRIKVFIITLLFFFNINSIYLYSDEVVELWASLYRNAETTRQKYEIMLSITEQNNREMIPTLMEALDELLKIRGIKDKKESEVHNQLISLVVQELGELKAVDAKHLLYRVVEQSEDPLLRADALIALGKTGAKEYSPHIAKLLENTTLYREGDIIAEEAVAYGCIYALERFRDPVGYFSVFLASVSGFSKRITDAAKQALKKIVDDPSQILAQIIRNEPSLKINYEALKAEINSSAPLMNKAMVSAEALKKGLILSSSNVEEETWLRELRITALQVFINLDSPYEPSIPLIEELLYKVKDQTEKFLALEALGSMGGDECAQVLARFLAFQNQRQQAGVTMEDNLMVISTIRALGATKSPVGREELMKTKFVGYPQPVLREVERVLSGLD